MKLQQARYVKLLFSEWDKYIWGHPSHPPSTTPTTASATSEKVDAIFREKLSGENISGGQALASERNEWARMCEEMKQVVNGDYLLYGMTAQGDGGGDVVPSSSSSSKVSNHIS